MINNCTPHQNMASNYDSSISSTGSSSSCATKQPDHMDGLLAGAGYKVRSSDLRQVAHRLERLQTAMVNSPSNISHLANDAVLNNPSDLSSWVDSLLSEFNHPVPDLSTISGLSYVDAHVGPQISYHPTRNDHHPPAVLCETPQQLTVVTELEEDSSIQLVHVLMTCAESVQRGELSLAGSLIKDLQSLLTRVNSGIGFGKVAGYFIDALSRRIFKPQGTVSTSSAFENEILYHHFYEATPYLKFAHFTANQAILEAFEGHDYVHVIDFNLMQGLQWPVLIQALALRSGGPPLLRVTGISPPSSDNYDSLREIGFKLAELARSVNVRFVFRGVTASRLDDVKSWMLQVDPKEVVAVNSVMQLHKILGNDSTRINNVLGWIHSLNPKILTLVEHEANHNKSEFFSRFTEALYYYSTMFDSLEVCSSQPEKALAELYIQREILNVVCCEGSARVERHEPLIMWRDRLSRASFTPLYLGSNAYKQASVLLTLFSAEGYCVEEIEGCLTLGWHNRPLIAASAWQAVPRPNSPNGVSNEGAE